MSPSYRKGIRSIERKVSTADSEPCKNHIRHLFLGSPTIARDRLFDHTRTIFAIAESTLAAGHENGTTNVSKHQCASSIFRKEDTFHAQRNRMVLVQQTFQFRHDMQQTVFESMPSRSMQHSIFEYANLIFTRL